MLSSISTTIVALMVIFLVLAICMVGLRVSARKTKSLSLEIDDYLIIAALVDRNPEEFEFGLKLRRLSLLVAHAATLLVCHLRVLILVCVHKLTHYRRHCGRYWFPPSGIKTSYCCHIPQGIFSISPMTKQCWWWHWEQFTFGLQFPYYLSVTLIKLSILSFYRRIFVSKNIRTAIKFMEILVILWFISFFFATLFQSIPISNNWAYPASNANKKGTINVYAMYVTASTMEIMLDILTLILPMFAIWKLQMRTSQKWQVSGIFLLGSLWAKSLSAISFLLIFGLQHLCRQHSASLLPCHTSKSKRWGRRRFNLYVYSPLTKPPFSKIC